MNKLINGLLMCAIAQTVSAHEFVVNEIIYQTISDTECEVMGTTNPLLEELYLPNIVSDGEKDYKMMKIHNFAFSQHQKLSIVYLQTNEEFEIGDEAFYRCTSLTSFNDGMITKLGRDVFLENYNLKFFGTVIKNEIPDRTFWSCQSLQSLPWFDNTLKRIGWCAFWNCNSLPSLYLPGSLEEIADGAFVGCYNLQVLEIGHPEYDIPKLKKNR